MGAFDFFFKSAGLSKTGTTNAYNEEYSNEMHDQAFNTNNMPSFDFYSSNGIYADNLNGQVKLVYNGILAKSGANDIYAVVGYGDKQNWENVSYYPMQAVGYQTFELLLPVSNNTSFNIAFKDGANNWDNNSGGNYVFNENFYGSH